MTNKEFSMEMDIIYENLNKGGGVGLDPYEKSVILTKAQETLVSELANSDLSLVGDLVRTAKVLPTTNLSTTYPKIDDRSTIFKLPPDYLRILNEAAYVYLVPNPNPSQLQRFQVIPIPFMEYTLKMTKPYNYPKRRAAWRLLNSGDTTVVDAYVEILARVLPVGDGLLDEYRITYLTFPDPIILQDLDLGEESIRGRSTESTTNLVATLHPFILDKAVVLAEKYYYDKYGSSPEEKEQE